MGLDMYLYAERKAPGLLVPAPTYGESEGGSVYTSDSVYISGWENNDSRSEYLRVVAAVGLTDVADPASPSLIVRPGDPPIASVTVAYWRKANAIHRWFVDECQGGIDECQVSDPISREKLLELSALCERILAKSTLIDGIVRNGRTLEGGEWRDHLEHGSKLDDPAVAQELLPTGGGFFFGSTDYDEGYVYDLKSTVEQIHRALKAPADTVFRYCSSW